MGLPSSLACPPALLVQGRIERTGGAVNLVAAALRPLRAPSFTGAAVASRDSSCTVTAVM